MNFSQRFYLLLLLVVVVLLTACSGDMPEQAVNSSPVNDIVLEIPEEEDEDQPYVEIKISPSPTIVETELLSTESSTVISTPVPTSNPEPTATAWIPMPLLGSEPHNPEREDVVSLLTDVGAQIIRYNGVVWYKVEPQEGERNWDALRKLDIALAELAARDIDVILIVRGTPGWAQKVYGAACGPISQEKFQAFADFMAELVTRYSSSPYNVKYWEIGNEPDVEPWLVPSSYPMGCWGDKQDPDYGGAYYAEMLKVVYPAIKAADSEAKVLIGGLLLDCDPTNPPEHKDCLPSRFLNGVLANGGQDYFDIVSFHGYPPFAGGTLKLDTNFPSWIVRGGVVVGKISYLRELMGLYGVEKPIFLTESSLICPEYNKADCVPPQDQFYQAQADYVVRMFLRNWALGVDGTIWYDFEGKGWRYGSLVGPDLNNPKPVYDAYKYLLFKLTNMFYIGEAPLPNELQGYIFSGENRRTWVIWSKDETPQSIYVPGDVVAVYDKYGQNIQLDGPQIEISSPIYFDLLP